MNDRSTLLYLITQSTFGGAQHYVYDLASNLKEDFKIIVAGGEQGYRGELPNKLREQNIRYTYLRHLKRAISPVHDFLAFIEMIKLIKDIEPDIIHLNSSKISILGSISGYSINLIHRIRCAFSPKTRISTKKIKIVYTVHGWVFDEDLPSWKKILYRTLEKLTLRLKDKIIFISHFERESSAQKGIIPSCFKNASVIYNGKEAIHFFSPTESRKEISRYISDPINENETVIGTIGNFTLNKGYKYLIKAFEILIKKQNLNFKAILIGDGKERKNVEWQIKKSKLEKHVFLTGNVPEAARYLPLFDVYICSSLKEGLSYAIIEAMQAGLPIIATRVGGNPELIEDYKTGYIIDPKNPEALAIKIKEVLENRDPATKTEARKKALRDFTLENMLLKTKKAYG